MLPSLGLLLKGRKECSWSPLTVNMWKRGSLPCKLELWSVMHGNRGEREEIPPFSHPLTFLPTWKAGGMGTSLRGQLPLNQSKAERGREWWYWQWWVGSWLMRMTSTYLPIYVTFLKDHKDFNSSTSLKYLLLPTGACVCLQVHAHTHTHTRVCVHMHMCAFAKFPPVSSWSLDLSKFEGKYNPQSRKQMVS